MTTPEQCVQVGRIVGVHGVQGEVKVESWTEPRQRLFDYTPWLLSSAPGEYREVAGVTGHAQGKGMVARLPGIDDRDQAAALNGTGLWIRRDQLPPVGPGKFYWADLEGLDVVTLEGVSLGRVSHLLATGANDVLVVRGERERLLPFVLDTCVKEVDLEGRRMVVDWDPEF